MKQDTLNINTEIEYQKVNISISFMVYIKYKIDFIYGTNFIFIFLLVSEHIYTLNNFKTLTFDH